MSDLPEIRNGASNDQISYNGDAISHFQKQVRVDTSGVKLFHVVSSVSAFFFYRWSLMEYEINKYSFKACRMGFILRYDLCVVSVMLHRSSNLLAWKKRENRTCFKMANYCILRGNDLHINCGHQMTVYLFVILVFREKLSSLLSLSPLSLVRESFTSHLKRWLKLDKICLQYARTKSL